MSSARAVEADAYTTGTYNGTTIDLSGKRGVLFIVTAGTLGSSATIDGSLEDSPNDSTWTAVSGSAITQITTSDGNGALMSYSSGANRYVRAVLIVGVATSDAGIAAATY